MESSLDEDRVSTMMKGSGVEGGSVADDGAPIMNGGISGSANKDSPKNDSDGGGSPSVPASPMGEAESGGKNNNNLDSHQSGSFGRKITEEDDPRPTEGSEVGNISQPDGGGGAEKNPQTNAVEDSKGSGTQQLSQLTVIDGPMANGGGGGPASRTPSVTDEQRSHTSNSSMGSSSVGELLGESADILEESGGDTVEEVVDDANNNVGSGGGGGDSPLQRSENTLSDIGSTEEQSGDIKKGHHKSASALPVVTTSESGGNNKPPPPGNLVRSASVPDNAASAIRLGTIPGGKTDNDDDDDDDDDENENGEIPQQMQSKIVEKSPAERYIRFKEKLGSGAYKDVYRAYDTIEGIEVAWNVVKLSGVPKVERVRIVNEVRLLERLHHPNIISFHGSWVNRETERVIFVTEILSSGTLKSFVQKVQLIRWKIFKRWAIQILKGLEYLHSQDPPIIHRDLKCDNIFINGTSGDLRIGDFGLSTAINKKNQPLSVLGTPEFMAPELYDENYNEKVDIYAFGMLLLEIITRDVPYYECTNPAQIYKKVTQGIPPPSLRRVKSEDAREFILLCLGIGEDANARPSASDLLKHPFLAKRSDDETTIEVEPAIEDMVIEEKNSMTFSDTGSERSTSNSDRKTGNADQAAAQLPGIDNKKFGSSIDGHAIPSRGAGSASLDEQLQKQGKQLSPLGGGINAVLPPRNTSKPLDSSKESGSFANKKSDAEEEDDDDEQADDHFGEMPENEANMKKVTVLMGRGTALDDDDEPPAQEMEVISLSATPPPAMIKAPSLPRSGSEAETSSLGSSSHQYKVSEMPGGDDNHNVVDGAVGPEASKPYPDDVINLVLTLPDEGQTRIEFDFDLVNDDPVQVAREMVVELEEVPDDAVLDISGAISGMARQARMKQNQWSKVQRQQHALAAQQQALQQQQRQHQQQALQQQQQQQAGMMMHPIQPQGMQAPQGTMMMPQQHMYGSGFAAAPPTAGSFQGPPAGFLPQPHLATSQPANDPSMGPASTALQQQQQQTQMQASQPQHVPAQQQPPLPPSHLSTPQMPNPVPTQMSTPQQPQQLPIHVHHSPAAAPPPIPQSNQQQFPPPPPQPTMARSPSMEMTSSHAGGGEIMNSNQTQGAAQVLPPPRLSTSTSQDAIAPRQLAPPPPVPAQDISTKALQNQNNALQGGAAAAVPSSSSTITSQKQQILQQGLSAEEDAASTSAAMSTEEEDGNNDSAEEDTEEIRKLEQEFEKKMQRAKKSYGTRMDNLQRSKVEAEAQHQMTLEKHEKERIEFEKRVRLAEEEQTRRLNQIQKEFIEKKKEVRQQHCEPPTTPPPVPLLQNGGHGIPGDGNGGGNNSRPPLHGAGGHKRSSSHFDMSTSSTSSLLTQQQQQQQQQNQTSGTPSLDHRRNSSESDIVAAHDNASRTLFDEQQVGNTNNASGGNDGRDRSGSASS